MIQELCSFQSEAEVTAAIGIEERPSHPSTAAAYELKFLINENAAGEVLAWRSTHGLRSHANHLWATPIVSPASTSTLLRWMFLGIAVPPPNANSGYVVTVTIAVTWSESERRETALRNGECLFSKRR